MSMSAKKKPKSRKKKGPKDPEIDFLKRLSDGSSDTGYLIAKWIK